MPFVALLRENRNPGGTKPVFGPTIRAVLAEQFHRIFHGSGGDWWEDRMGDVAGFEDEILGATIGAVINDNTRAFVQDDAFLVHRGGFSIPTKGAPSHSLPHSPAPHPPPPLQSFRTCHSGAVLPHLRVHFTHTPRLLAGCTLYGFTPLYPSLHTSLCHAMVQVVVVTTADQRFPRTSRPSRPDSQTSIKVSIQVGSP